MEACNQNMEYCNMPLFVLTDKGFKTVLYAFKSKSKF